jgi:hypothetical protein
MLCLRAATLWRAAAKTNIVLQQCFAQQMHTSGLFVYSVHQVLTGAGW